MLIILYEELQYGVRLWLNVISYMPSPSLGQPHPFYSEVYIIIKGIVFFVCWGYFPLGWQGVVGIHYK